MIFNAISNDYTTNESTNDIINKNCTQMKHVTRFSLPTYNIKNL